MTPDARADALGSIIPTAAAAVIVELAKKRKPMDLGALAEATGRPRSKVVEAVSYLEEEGFVTTRSGDVKGPQGGRPPKVVSLVGRGVTMLLDEMKGVSKDTGRLIDLLQAAREEATE